jgi:hypothetical protein
MEASMDLDPSVRFDFFFSLLRERKKGKRKKLEREESL